MLSLADHLRCSTGVVDALAQEDIAQFSVSCRTWRQHLQAMPNGCWRNLNLNGSARPAEMLSLAASKPAVASSIRRVSFEFCNSLQNFDLVQLGQFPALTELNLNGCRNLTDSAIEIVAEQCHKLERLDLYWLVVLTDISTAALSNAAFPPLLRHLNLSGLKHITDATVVPLLRRCSNLTFLDLTRCEGLRDDTLKAVGQSCPHITTLLLYATPHMTDVGFEGLAPGLKQLTHLDITGMKFITDRSIAALASHCRKLKVLHLMWVTPLTDASLVAMGQAPLDQLELLSIHGNVHMTASGLETLAKGCKNLKQLDMNGCKNMGEYRNNKEAIKRIFPKFEKLIFL